MIESTCENCRERPATVRDYALRAGQWVVADVCDTCARRRRMSPLGPILGAASAAALLGGLAFALERLVRGSESGELPNPAPDWTRRLRGGTPTLLAYSRDLTAEAREGKLDR